MNTIQVHAINFVKRSGMVSCTEYTPWSLLNYLYLVHFKDSALGLVSLSDRKAVISVVFFPGLLAESTF